MFTEKQLRSHLERISPNPVFVRFDFFGAAKFLVQIKCDIDNDHLSDCYTAYVDRWVTSFASFTGTAWGARNAYSKMKTQLLQRSYCCRPADAGADCRAHIQFKVKLINCNTDISLNILVDFNHSHSVHASPAAVSDTDELFFDYFDAGFNAITAKSYHELVLLGKYGADSARCINDKLLNPNSGHIRCLVDKMQGKGIKRSFRDSLEAKKASIEAAGGALVYDDKPEVVVVTTPLMTRVMRSRSLDCVLVDSNVVKSGLVVTYFYVSDKIGALPVACVMHTEATEDNFKEAFDLLTVAVQGLVPDFHPKVFIGNDMEQQKKALSHSFPKSKVLASRWSVCSETWQWLCKEDLQIAKRGRYSLMFLFKSLIYARPDTAHAHYRELRTNTCNSTSRLQEYVNGLWTRSDEWLAGDENQGHPLTEISMQLTKEFLLRKCKFFNVVMMIDVVSKLLENQLKSLIDAYIEGVPKLSMYTVFFQRSYSKRFNEHIMQIRLNEYMVQYQSSPNLYYYVKMDTACCDCAIGRQGRLCDHLGIILNKGASGVNIPLLANAEVEALVKFLEPAHDDGTSEATAEARPAPERAPADLGELQQSNADGAHAAPPASPGTMEKSSIIKRYLGHVELYMLSIQKLNNEFQKLLKYLKSHPNLSDAAAIDHIARELGHARPND